MTSMIMTIHMWRLAYLLCALVVPNIRVGAAASPPVAQKEGAYATLLYGDDFLLGVRVLGQSIRETKTQ